MQNQPSKRDVARSMWLLQRDAMERGDLLLAAVYATSVRRLMREIGTRYIGGEE